MTDNTDLLKNVILCNIVVCQLSRKHLIATGLYCYKNGLHFFHFLQNLRK